MKHVPFYKVVQPGRLHQELREAGVRVISVRLRQGEGGECLLADSADVHKARTIIDAHVAKNFVEQFEDAGQHLTPAILAALLIHLDQGGRFSSERQQQAAAILRQAIARLVEAMNPDA
ncbi:MAG: hypothetical protein KatS3mg105_1250 [Gemmatales bacterium]|nr:MAG: hypothetical protein KatS3mg105_1250 [Gemmatales bacterium]